MASIIVSSYKKFWNAEEVVLNNFFSKVFSMDKLMYLSAYNRGETLGDLLDSSAYVSFAVNWNNNKEFFKGADKYLTLLEWVQNYIIPLQKKISKLAESGQNNLMKVRIFKNYRPMIVVTATDDEATHVVSMDAFYEFEAIEDFNKFYGECFSIELAEILRCNAATMGCVSLSSLKHLSNNLDKYIR